MPAGIQIINDAYTVQIDENWKNYGFRQKIAVFQSITTPATTPFLTYTLVVPGRECQVAVKSSVFKVMAANSYFDGSNYYFHYLLIPPEATGTHSETIEFYVFDVPYTGAFSNVGLEVFNAAGERVFHSDMRPMKVAGVVGAASFTGTPGRVYVPLIAINPLTVLPLGFPLGNRLHFYALQVFGHQIVSVLQVSPYVSPYIWSNAGLYTPIDVTGL